MWTFRLYLTSFNQWPISIAFLIQSSCISVTLHQNLLPRSFENDEEDTNLNNPIYRCFFPSNFHVDCVNYVIQKQIRGTITCTSKCTEMHMISWRLTWLRHRSVLHSVLSNLILGVEQQELVQVLLKDVARLYY